MEPIKLLLALILLTFLAFHNPVKGDPIIEAIPIEQKLELLLDKRDRKEVQCLAVNMYHEAKNQGLRGMKAVGLVTINRVNSKKFPNTICGVITQKRRNVCQFSWYCQRVKLNPKSKEYIQSLILAFNLYTKQQNDFTNGALFFHANYVKPYWRKHFNKTIVVKDHIFYAFKGKS